MFDEKSYSSYVILVNDENTVTRHARRRDREHVEILRSGLEYCFVVREVSPDGSLGRYGIIVNSFELGDHGLNFGVEGEATLAQKVDFVRREGAKVCGSRFPGVEFFISTQDGMARPYAFVPAEVTRVSLRDIDAAFGEIEDLAHPPETRKAALEAAWQIRLAKYKADQAIRKVRIEALYANLVPPAGMAPTVEGEVLRAAAAISRDWDDQSFGANWSGALAYVCDKVDVHPRLKEVLERFSTGRALDLSVSNGQKEAAVSRLVELAEAFAERADRPTPNDVDMTSLDLPDYDGYGDAADPDIEEASGFAR